MHDLRDAPPKIARMMELLSSLGGLRLTAAISGVGAGQTDSAGQNEASKAGLGAGKPEIAVELSGPDTPLLLARNAELLHAIEHIAAKILRLEPEEHDRISFDAEQFKANRDRDLRLAAEAAVAQVRTQGRPFTLPAMSSRERRLVHLAVSPSGLRSASTGEGARRSVVIYPMNGTPNA
jgi:spoIIIJ-associated protein